MAGGHPLSTLRRLASVLLPDGVAESVRRLMRRLTVARYSAYDVRHSYGGLPLIIRIADPLAQGWYDQDGDAGTEITLLQRRGRLGPGARVFDLGAHQGVVALMLAGIVGSEGQVIAVEAVPHNARIATQNATANECRQLVVLLALIPPDYEVLVAPGEAGDFAPLAAGVALLGARCRIVALAPRTPEITSHV